MRLAGTIPGDGQGERPILQTVAASDDRPGEIGGVDQPVAVAFPHVLLLNAMVGGAVENERFARCFGPCGIRTKPVDAHGTLEEAFTAEPDDLFQTILHRPALLKHVFVDAPPRLLSVRQRRDKPRVHVPVHLDQALPRHQFQRPLQV